MVYSVIINGNDEFSQAYLQGCEKCYQSREEAEAYIQSFEDWEQSMLRIDVLPV